MGVDSPKREIQLLPDIRTVALCGLSVRSQPGVGSTFMFELPVAETAEAAV
jgi:hypothetical protein